MNIGYARVSTQDQNLALQLDALKKQGCEKIYQEKASGSGVKVDWPELAKLLEQLRQGDTLYIWKLDRLGRSLKHLVDVVECLGERGIGLVSLNDPVDTTTAQGRLTFRIFASLAEFERELIRERTQAGLASSRRRGQQLGRKKGLSKSAENKSRIAETLYKEKSLTVQEIADQLGIAKPTLYVYLKHRGVQIGGK